ncbi:hypothetical protein NDI45_07915 [Leptolyngbya sp. GB1-A1]|uniref:hypothetical protein n=1 Tax=Leptolyngbya sp. GB1-A1 TaxID=2933908 RepID=UPI0032991926
MKTASQKWEAVFLTLQDCDRYKRLRFSSIESRQFAAALVGSGQLDQSQGKLEGNSLHGGRIPAFVQPHLLTRAVKKR